MNVVVIGGSNIDVCAKSSTPLIEKDSNIGKVEFALGGVGRNIAEDLCLLGTEASLLTAIGNDSFGQVVIDNANEQGIVLIEEPFKGEKTGVYAYIVNSDGQSVYGINDMEITNQITPEVIKKNINYLSFTDYVLFEANLSEETIQEICSHDFKLIADCVSTTKCTRLAKVLDKLYLLKANEAEAFILTGTDNLTDAIKAFVKKGLKRGIITLGTEGAMCFETEDGVIKTYSIPNMPDEDVIDVSGCGDAFLAGFVVAIIRGKDIKGCLTSGQSAACLNAGSLSSVNRKMTYSALKEKVAKFKKITVITEGEINE